MEVRVTVRLDENDGPRFVRKRMSENLGGLTGLGGNYEEGEWVRHQLDGGDYYSREMLDRCLNQLDLMFNAAVVETVADAWEGMGLPADQAKNFAILRVQHVERISEVIEIVEKMYETVAYAELLVAASDERLVKS